MTNILLYPSNILLYPSNDLLHVDLSLVFAAQLVFYQGQSKVTCIPVVVAVSLEDPIII